MADCLGSPFIENRGVKFNIPLDARTPGFDDTGDAAQKNITEMWSWEFWEEYLDHVALDDVYRTTLKPVGEENEWGDPGLVSSNVMENLERVAVISIDDKIRFWQKVMKRAADTGCKSSTAWEGGAFYSPGLALGDGSDYEILERLS